MLSIIGIAIIIIIIRIQLFVSRNCIYVIKRAGGFTYAVTYNFIIQVVLECFMVRIPYILT